MQKQIAGKVQKTSDLKKPKVLEVNKNILNQTAPQHQNQNQGNPPQHKIQIKAPAKHANASSKV